VTCFTPRDSLPRQGWLEQDLEDVLQGELDLPLRSKPTRRTIVRVTSAVSRHTVNWLRAVDNDFRVSSDMPEVNDELSSVGPKVENGGEVRRRSGLCAASRLIAYAGRPVYVDDWQ
jgi:hypothetical protein